MKRMLVVVDYQKDFVDGALGFPGAETLDPGIARKVREAVTRGDLVVYTLDTHGADYLETREGRALPVPHCIEGTDGWELYGETGAALLAAGDKAVPLRKQTFGVSPQLMARALPHDGVGRIELVGLVTNMCVLSNACVFQAMYPHAQIVVDAALCASFDQGLHQKTLDVLRGVQVQVEEEAL